MRFLVLGGTSFVGRHIVEAALAGGHDVSLFNRGTTNADLFPDCDHRRGDRYAGEIDALKTGEWDAVVDVNAYIPRHVREAVDLLTGRVGTYCFISTGSVYSELDAASIDEDAPVGELDDPTNEEVTNETYGPLKVLCERAAEDFTGTTVVVRPGIVAGAHDPTGRFTYWVRRLARGGRVLGPPRADQPVQVVHGRDQGDFVVKLLTDGVSGTFNSVGPDEPATFADLIDACVVAGAARNTEVFYREGPPLPLVLPPDGSMDGIFRISNERAKTAGLRNRSLEETAADTLAWDRAEGQPEIPGVPTEDEEAKLLTDDS